MKDLTKGKPSRLILAFALPIFLANLLQLTYSLVDTRIVGSFLGEDALAAVGATSSLSNLIIGFLMGLSNGFAIITAQRFGAKDLRGVKKSFAMSLTLGIAVAAGLTVLGLLFLQPILRFLNVPENLRTMAGSYIVIIIAGYHYAFGDSCNLCHIEHCGGSLFCGRFKNGGKGSRGCHGFGTGVGVCDLLDLYDKTV